jgi:hypothetical protein
VEKTKYGRKTSSITKAQFGRAIAVELHCWPMEDNGGYGDLESELKMRRSEAPLI